MDVRKLKTIMELFEKSDLHEMELTEEGETLRLVKKPRGGAAPPQVVATAAPAQPASEPPPTAGEEATAPPAGGEQAPPAAPAEGDGLHELTSPMVGTFYARPSPDDPPYVVVGDEVQEGATVCVIEAMKLFNPIEAPVSGKIVAIEVDNGQPVGFGDLLMKIKPS